mgnify:CR=1 FL=1|jgi:NADH-quinone oxidoreductase subunit M
MENHLLSLVTFLPMLGILAILFVPRARVDVIRWIAAGATGLQLVVALIILGAFDSSSSGIQMQEHAAWIPAFNIEYFLGIDGLSLPMVLLTPFLSFLAIFTSFSINKAEKSYFALFLLLDVGMMGVFLSLDFFLFYIFWEVMLLPMYFLIGIWGGDQKEYAAIKFFLYTLFGSVLLLLGMLALYFVSEPHTFNMLILAQQPDIYSQSLLLGMNAGKVIFLLLFVGFAIKVPIFPFHTWLPLAHVQAPTAVSVILAGVLLKMGAYGFLRISFPILPHATLWFALPMAILGLINIVYGAMAALAQKDLKKMVAYSSVNHMGYVLIGMAAMTSAGMNGAVFQMFNHGTITAMLFMLVGVIYDRAHHRDIEGFGGLATKVPLYAGVMGFAFFAGLGLPGLSGFISEALCFIGAFPVFTWIAIGATVGIVLNAAYFLWAYQRIFFGPLNPKYENLEDINKRELYTLIPLAMITLFLGIYPAPMLDLMSATLNHLVDTVNAAGLMTGF